MKSERINIECKYFITTIIAICTKSIGLFELNLKESAIF